MPAGDDLTAVPAVVAELKTVNSGRGLDLAVGLGIAYVSIPKYYGNLKLLYHFFTDTAASVRSGPVLCRTRIYYRDGQLPLWP